MTIFWDLFTSRDYMLLNINRNLRRGVAQSFMAVSGELLVSSGYTMTQTGAVTIAALIGSVVGSIIQGQVL